MEKGFLQDLMVPHIDRSTKPVEKWADVWAKAQTGDVLLVSGARDLDSSMAQAIKAATRSCFSHIGLLVREPTEAMWQKYGRLRGEAAVEGEAGPWGEGEEVPRDRQIYIFDSDYEEDGTVDGPVLRPLQDVLMAYLADDYHGTDADIVIRRLEVDDENRRIEMRDQLTAFADTMAGRCFEAKAMTDGKFLQMLMSVWGGNPSEDLTRLFCSELAEAAYEAMGLIDESENATNYQPEHFAESKMVELQGGARLGPEVVIDLNECLHEISVTVVSAENVYARWFNPFGDIYPFCIVKLAGRERFRTPEDVAEVPKWNHEQTVMYDGVSSLDFELWDKNAFQEGRLGVASLESDRFSGKGFKGTIDIPQEGTDVPASLKVRVEIVRKGCGAYCTSGVLDDDKKKGKKEKKAKDKKEKRDKHDDKKKKDKKDKKEKKKKEDRTWAREYAFGMFPEGEEWRLRGKVHVLDKSKISSLTKAVEMLQTCDQCPEGLCAVFSASQGQWYLLYEADKKEDALELARSYGAKC